MIFSIINIDDNYLSIDDSPRVVVISGIIIHTNAMSVLVNNTRHTYIHNRLFIMSYKKYTPLVYILNSIGRRGQRDKWQA